MAVAGRIESGIVHINDQTVHDEPQIPFGGIKDSGWGRFGGKAALEEFTELRWISAQSHASPVPVLAAIEGQKTGRNGPIYLTLTHTAKADGFGPSAFAPATRLHPERRLKERNARRDLGQSLSARLLRVRGAGACGKRFRFLVCRDYNVACLDHRVNFLPFRNL